MSAPATTIVSLIASGTEIVCGLGLRDNLVGRSHECDFPASVGSLPILSEPKVDPSRSSGDIDRSVRDIVADGLSVYRLRVEELQRLHPDVIVTQDQCEVCAVSLVDVEDALCRIDLDGTTVCSLRPNCLADVWEDIRRVAAAAGVPERGDALVAELTVRMRHIETLAREAPPVRVALIEWLDPPMVAGGWMPEIARIANTVPVIVETPEAFRQVSWQDIAETDPDLVAVLPCGFDVGRTVEETAHPEVARGLREIPAVARGDCWLLDGNALFNRPGPRLVESAALLAAIAHPELTFPIEREQVARRLTVA